jgi:uncharacterized protein YjbI with pentapeptide repeats
MTTFPSPLTQSTDPNQPTSLAGSIFDYSVIGLNWSCLDLTSAKIQNLPTNLANLNAYAARLPNRSFQSFILDGANFGSATLNDAIFSLASLKAKANFNGALIVGGVMTSAKIDQATFVGAALGGVAQSQASDFSFAYIANCDFSECNLFGASFAGATLIGANKLNSGANLLETDFSNAYMPNVDFTDAVLQGAKFDGAFMVECTLTGADLSPSRDGAVPSSLTSACLQGATFLNVNLSGADLSNASITASSGSIVQQYYDEYGNLTQPSSIDYPAKPYPNVSSFSSQKVCPNGANYGTNQADGLSMAQMMEATNPPTNWKPVGSPAEVRHD